MKVSANKCSKLSKKIQESVQESSNVGSVEGSGANDKLPLASMVKGMVSKDEGLRQ